MLSILSMGGGVAARLSGRQGFVPWASWGITFVLAFCFWAERRWQLAPGPSVSANSLLAMGGLYPPFLWHDHQWHRLFTAVLLHVNTMHLVMNCGALILAGAVLEAMVGRWWFTALFLTGGLMGSIMSLAVLEPDTVSSGASGAIMCLLAAALVLSFRLPTTKGRILLQVRLAFFLVPVLGTMLTDHPATHGVDYGAHAGGAICGTMAGLILCILWPTGEDRPPLKSVAMIVTAIGIYLYGFSAVMAALHFSQFADQYRWGLITL